MNNKKYEDYHVLDEETDNLDLEQENEQTNKLSKLVEIEPEINMIDTHTEQSVGNEEIGQSEVIDVDVINQGSRDTSFSSYIAADKKRERSFLVKWGTRLAKLILFMMLLPVIGIVGGGVLFIAGGITLGILACIGGGLFILGTTCFIATQVNTTIIALGISTGITAISFGGIVLVLCMMFIKKMNQLIHQNKANKKNKEVR